MHLATFTLTRTAAAGLAIAALGGFGVAGAKAAPHSSCDLVPRQQIKAALGLTVGTPSVNHTYEAVTVCTYHGKAGSVVIVRFQTGMTHAAFLEGRKEFAVYKVPVKTSTVLRLPAYWSTIVGASGALRVTTLAVLKGHTELLVSAAAPLAKIVALAKTVLPKI